MWWEDESRFKLGDLVVIKEKIDFFSFSIVANEGDVGLIVGVDFDIESYTLWGVDYVVLIHGRRLIFFDSELEMANTKPK